MNIYEREDRHAPETWGVREGTAYTSRQVNKCHIGGDKRYRTEEVYDRRV